MPRKLGGIRARVTLASIAAALAAMSLVALTLALDTATRIDEVVAALLLVLVLLSGIFAWLMTGRTLGTVERMRQEVGGISADDLERRITPPENDPELSALADTFNGLLDRVETSTEERKRFVSDASHELKSPIAAIGVMLESLRANPEGLANPETLADLTAENSRLAGIVDDLLALSRLDEGRLKAEFSPIDYYDLLHEEAKSLGQRSGVVVDVSGICPVVGTADAQLLSHAVRNLLDNAARYAASTVRISCRGEDGRIAIAVSDDGPGIPEADRERVFGRFVRLDEGRMRDTGGTGLGLSVARGNVERMGGAIRFTDPELGGATALIELPA